MRRARDSPRVGKKESISGNWDVRLPIRKVKFAMERRHAALGEVEAGRGVPLSERGLVTVDRARADAGALARAAILYESGVFDEPATSFASAACL